MSRLSPREQRLILVFLVVALCAGTYVFAIEPLVAGRARLESRIATLARDLEAMQRSAARIRTLDAALGDEIGQQTGRDFSLFSFIDRATTASVASEAVASMNPSRRPLRDGSEESTVELRLTRVSLPEVVALLRQINDAGQPVFVKRLELKRRYDDRTRFDATVVAASIART
jgi:type II secretory pathway component PulM